jgi:glycosyltransferase involved in cell wall biosynthesis
LEESLSVYYCIDDYASLPNVDPEAIAAMDDQLTRKADIVFVASKTLLENKLALNGNTHYSPHGVDVDHFARAHEGNGPLPREMERLAHPIVGFFGLIDERLDVELVEYLARRRPEWEFVLIGRVALPAAGVPQTQNVHFLGPRPYESLPDYGRHFDATIIPYRNIEHVGHINPLKLREYLAMGKPVVSVRIPEAEKLSDVIAIADARDEFLSLLDAAVSNSGDETAARRRISRVAPESWEARVQAVLSHVKKALADDNPPNTDVTRSFAVRL